MSESKRLVHATIKGTLWNYSAYALGKGLVFVSTVILARLLTPDDFGLLALALIVISYLDVFSDLGVKDAVIYRDGDADQNASVAFWLSLMTNITLTLAAILLSPLAARFFRETEVTLLLQVLALTFVLSGLGSIHESRLKKSMQFKQLFAAEMGRTIVKGGLSILLALLGFGVWSLVIGQLAGTLTATIILWIALPWRPRFGTSVFDREIARSLSGYGAQIILVDLLGMVHKNIDYLIVGRRMDSTQLGYYSMAFRIPELVVISTCYIVSRALFPAYVHLRKDMQALRKGFLKTLQYTSLFTVPVSIGTFIVTPDFIRVLYGDQWLPAIPVMQVLSLYALVYSLSFNAGDVYKALGKPSILNQLSIVKLGLTLPVLWWAAGYNIFYVALGQAAVNALLTLIKLWVAGRIMEIRLGQIWKTLLPSFSATLVMGVGAYAVYAGMSGTVFTAQPLMRLAVVSLVGALLYMAALWLMNRPLVLDGLKLARSLRSGVPALDKVGE